MLLRTMTRIMPVEALANSCYQLRSAFMGHFVCIRTIHPPPQCVHFILHSLRRRRREVPAKQHPHGFASEKDLSRDTGAAAMTLHEHRICHPGYTRSTCQSCPGKRKALDNSRFHPHIIRSSVIIYV